MVVVALALVARPRFRSPVALQPPCVSQGLLVAGNSFGVGFVDFMSRIGARPSRGHITGPCPRRLILAKRKDALVWRIDLYYVSSYRINVNWIPGALLSPIFWRTGRTAIALDFGYGMRT